MQFKETLNYIMDIATFNKELGTKIARAKGLERNDNIKAAIKLWLDISEMALRFSKSRNLDASFKNMIINRTQGIFAHVKNLKASQDKDEKIIDEVLSQEELPLLEHPLEIEKNEKSAFSKLEKQETNHLNSTITSHKIVENSEFEKVPKGFKEIQVPKEFKIITPHDDNYVKKRLSQVEKIGVSTPKKEGSKGNRLQPPEDRIEFDQPEDGNILICFACGTENSIDEKICKSCGTKLS